MPPFEPLVAYFTATNPPVSVEVTVFAVVMPSSIREFPRADELDAFGKNPVVSPEMPPQPVQLETVIAGEPDSPPDVPVVF